MVDLYLMTVSDSLSRKLVVAEKESVTIAEKEEVLEVREATSAIIATRKATLPETAQAKGSKKVKMEDALFAMRRVIRSSSVHKNVMEVAETTDRKEAGAEVPDAQDLLREESLAVHHQGIER